MAFNPRPSQTGTIAAAATPVTIVSSPAASTIRMVNKMTVHNRDNVEHTLTVRIDDASAKRVEDEVILQPGDKYEYEGQTISLDDTQFIEALVAALPTTPLEFSTSFADKT